MRWTPILLALILAGCPADDQTPDGAGTEAGLTDAASPDLPPSPKWQRGQVEASKLKVIRGLRVARGVIHAHSLHSHDACDGKPTINGKPNEPCLADMRAGLCDTKIDFIMMSEHTSSMALTDFEKLLLLRSGDEAVLKNGAKVANRIKCKAGAFRPLLLMGAELNRSMPVGLERHVDKPGQDLKKLYSGKEASLDAKLKAAGAVLLQAHTESKPLADLKAHALDGIEVYNLHANLDPKIRKLMGLEPLGYLNDTAPFMGKEATGPEPDLAFVAFFAESDIAMQKWSALLALRPTAGVLGTDAHQNVLNLKMRDDERMDSYRRMFRWFSNHARVKTVTFDAVKEAIKLGRGYMVFEVIGTPDGFDFHAKAGNTTVEMGGAAKLADAPLLRVTAPTVYGLSPAVKAPALELRLLHVDAAGKSKVVMKGSGSLVANAAAAGAYRVEVHITPHHLRPHLGKTPDKYIKKLVWIYSNPIYVK